MIDYYKPSQVITTTEKKEELAPLSQVAVANDLCVVAKLPQRIQRDGIFTSGSSFQGAHPPRRVRHRGPPNLDHEPSPSETALFYINHGSQEPKESSQARGGSRS